MALSASVLAVLAGLAAASLSTHRSRRRVLGRLEPLDTTPRVRAPNLLATRIEAADLPIGPDQFFSRWIGATLLALASVVSLGGVGLLLLGAASAGPIVLLGATRGRRAARRRAELVVFADAIASAVRGGASIPSAVAAAQTSVQGALATEVAELTWRIDRGLPVAAAYSGWAADPDPDVRLTGRAISMVAEHGGRAAEALERTATVLRAREDLRRERAGMATQARSSAMVMTAAPLAFAVVSGLADPRTLHFLVTTPLGLGCLTFGVVLDVVGGRWMSSIVSRAT